VGLKTSAVELKESSLLTLSKCIQHYFLNWSVFTKICENYKTLILRLLTI
jgi:hypothetical protein